MLEDNRSGIVLADNVIGEITKAVIVLEDNESGNSVRG
jgi:hypothetical protein